MPQSTKVFFWNTSLKTKERDLPALPFKNELKTFVLLEQTINIMVVPG